MYLLRGLFILFCTSLASSSYANVQSHFNQIKSSPKALYQFLKSMPKGGELHYHLAGGAYPETMLNLASEADYCIKASDFSISKKNPCHHVPSTKLKTDSKLYEHMIEAWSMKRFASGLKNGHDHFFASFFKFMPIVVDYRPQLLAEVIKRASSQQELYLEVMILPDNAHSIQFDQIIKKENTLKAKKKKLLENKSFQSNIDLTIAESHRILTEARTILGCDEDSNQAGCHLTVKFQYYLLRQQPLDNFFAQAVNGFAAAAAASSDIVGINLVEAEDGALSLQNYRQQMQIIRFLHAAYPSVHISLHAGELSPELVNEEDLSFHIQEAIYVGQAERIGHGVAIVHEHDVESLLHYMAQKPIPVEINLTSNATILNIKGKKHPLRYYLKHHIPVVLSTDDEGILRTTLTNEYLQAVLQHQLDYKTLKKINQNALTYSFLPGDSLWQDPKHQIPVKACTKIESLSCKKFVQKSEKAQLQWQLEKALAAFERQFERT